MEYEIEFLTQAYTDFDTGKPVPYKILDVTEDAANLIRLFADVEKDEILQNIYVINKTRFKIMPVMRLKESSELLQPAADGMYSVITNGQDDFILVKDGHFTEPINGTNIPVFTRGDLLIIGSRIITFKTYKP